MLVDAGRVILLRDLAGIWSQRSETDLLEASISDQRAVDQYCRFTKQWEEHLSSHVTSWKSWFIMPMQFFFFIHVAACCMRWEHVLASRAGGRADLGRLWCWLGVFPTAWLRGLRPPVETVAPGTATSAKQSGVSGHLTVQPGKPWIFPSEMLK